MNKVLQEKRKKKISKMPLIGKIGVYLWVYKVWFEERNVKGYYWECNKFNLYNPLFWIMIILIIPIAVGKGIFELFKDVHKMGKVSRFG